MYCTFDLPKAVWVLHQGRPVVTQPAHDGFYRGDTLSVYRAEQTVPAADELILFLRSYLADVGQPFVSPLPPVDEEPADLLCYWGGDDEAIAGTHLPAAEFMHSQGLPYHSNILYRKDGTFAINRAEAEELKRLGTEVSLHYNFREFGQHPRHFTRAEVHKQAVAFRETFGHAPGCTVNHWSLWTGWHQPAVWMAEAGGRGDNSFLPLKGDRPCYRFGTSLPYRFYADHTGENARLPFLAQPATCYEPLYGTPNNSGEGEEPRDRGASSPVAPVHRCNCPLQWRDQLLPPHLSARRLASLPRCCRVRPRLPARAWIDRRTPGQRRPVRLVGGSLPHARGTIKRRSRREATGGVRFVTSRSHSAHPPG